ncbi:MAG TPA: hypothetical protein VMV35_09710 [Halothiobacillus sp.]|nr:hypothetical protein [Halothiobacillus sp.]
MRNLNKPLLLQRTLLLLVIAPLVSEAAGQRLPALPLQPTSVVQPTPTVAAESGVCSNHRFVKSLALTRVWIPAPPADILRLGTALSELIAKDLDSQGTFRTTLIPATRATNLAPAIGSFTQTGRTYFVRISGHDFIPSGQDSSWSFFGPSSDPRSGTLDITIDDSARETQVAHSEISAEPIGTSPYRPPIDARGAPFWVGAYGQSLQHLAEHTAEFISQSLDCEPLQGQVIRVEGTQITINRGADDGLRISDQPRLLRRSAPISLLGQEPLPERHLLESLGTTDIIHLGHRSTVLRYMGPQLVQVGDLVQAGE